MRTNFRIDKDGDFYDKFGSDKQIFIYYKIVSIALKNHCLPNESFSLESVFLSNKKVIPK